MTRSPPSTLFATSGSQDENRVDHGTGSAKKGRPVARRNTHILCVVTGEISHRMWLASIIAASGSQDEDRVDHGTGCAKKGRPAAWMQAVIVTALPSEDRMS